VRNVGSGNIGATNVLRTGSKGLAAATLLLDMLKGTAAVLIVEDIAARWVGFNAFQYAYIAGLGAFLGHLYPVWLGFRGGKGVATFIGVLLGVHIWAAVLFCIVWVAVALSTRYSSLAALSATGAVLLYYLVTGWGGWPAFTFILLMAALIVFRHQSNIRRLMAGEESRIGARS
jgi:glycerol-3-phosphate acyltransferase PlsY